MKKQLILLTLAMLLSSCGAKGRSSSISSADTTSSDTTDTETISITPETKAKVGDWSQLAPYLEFALGEYAQYVPSYRVHEYNVSYQVEGELTAIQIDCLKVASEDSETAYSEVLTLNGFQVVDNEPMYAYMMVSTFDCLYVDYLQSGTTFSILAYYRQVRVADWPTALVEELVGKNVPVLEADAYFYTYDVNVRGFIYVSVDCFFNNGIGTMDGWLKTLTKAGYEFTSQGGYYTAVSSDGEIIITFDDYYGDGTNIPLTIYSRWPSYDYKMTFGFDLPKYSGEYSDWGSFYTGDYVVINYYDVDSTCLTTYANQLKKLGFVLDHDFNDEEKGIVGSVYYLPKTINGVEEPWIQIQYKEGILAVAVPYTVIYEE